MNRFDNVRHIISFEMFKQVEDIHDKLDKKLFGNRNTAYFQEPPSPKGLTLPRFD